MSSFHVYLPLYPTYRFIFKLALWIHCKREKIVLISEDLRTSQVDAVCNHTDPREEASMLSKDRCLGLICASLLLMTRFRDKKGALLFLSLTPNSRFLVIVTTNAFQNSCIFCHQSRETWGRGVDAVFGIARVGKVLLNCCV